jgi:hypothetical protein
MTSRHRRFRRGAVALVGAACLAAPALARAEPEECYALATSALTAPGGAELALRLTTGPGCVEPLALARVNVRTIDRRGRVRAVHVLDDVPLAGGTATVDLGAVRPGETLDVRARLRTDEPRRAWILRAQTLVLLRPDLVVASLTAPAQTLASRPADVTAQIRELNGEVGATATVALAWGPSVLATRTISVLPGGVVAVTFPAITPASPAHVELTARVVDVVPGETDVGNNERTAIVDVTEHELAPSRLVLDGLGGYGFQFNQNVFASVSAAPPASIPDLESKVKALEPQLVRIFFHEIDAAGIPERLASFRRTVRLAHEAGASINITYQTSARAKHLPDRYMGEFAALLDELIRGEGLTGVRWVTIQNEPNTTLVTLPEYEALHRAIDAHLRARGLREHVGIMAGDLVELGASHRRWLQFIAANLNDIVDAYSEHIYWDYWNTPRMAFRLRDVRKATMEELPPEARKPIYVTEFAVRGIRTFEGRPVLEPGVWADGTLLARTNVAAFQQLWFNVAAAQLGFSGTAKWDAYWGNYNDGRMTYWAIGPPDEGWPLFPTYHAMRLLLQTTARGWQVVRVEPWSDDDWVAGMRDQPEKELAAYVGPNGALTVLGLDTHGAELNGASGEAPEYSIGGLPALTSFTLVVWNANGDGDNGVAGTVTTNAAGVARFTVPVHAAFALTTVPVG